MARRRGLQTEVLVSLALVMGTATVVLGALALASYQSQIGALQKLAGRSLLAQAEQGGASAVAGSADVVWWRVAASGAVQPLGAHAAPLDEAAQALAERARSQERALLDVGPPWQPLRFAAPAATPGAVLVASLPAATTGAWLLAMALTGIVVFTCFGLVLLQRRLVSPLQRLEQTAAALADGDLGARAVADGPRETFAVATAFNAMAESLEKRTGALEKAVADLRASNRELREAREGLDRAERLAAVGRLAAGVAHEVGNPMGAVLAFVDLARRDPGLGEGGRGHLERALEEGRRMRKVLQQLLDFSRPSRAERAPLDLAALVGETADLVRSQRCYAGVRIEVVREGVAPAALADRQQVTQIVLNLLLNAADAPSREIRVTVRGRAQAVRPGEPEDVARQRARFEFVECCVADDGPGVPPENRERIFDPFFSTKQAGEGTGLGLSNALRFAQEAGGGLELADAERGACFRFWLPAAGAHETGGVR